MMLQRPFPHVTRARKILLATCPAYARRVEHLGGYEHVPILRLRLDGGARLHKFYFEESETTVLAVWMAGFATGETAGALPVPEFPKPTWAKWDPATYRWTVRAWDWVEHVARERESRAAGCAR